mmetsp:Transcript_28618/g.48062  ORF Transcript_28618/g.48062 Transcript_28618/m.48062 type:complete len:235 (+) Transcript_28618:143-847(+)|eukprot:CAMPEP_0198208046 /NCGR_PEP_ID=MMETSP1445-20131203/11442_1 /TAXON_ID=36898 /ORGANISM="Pyramimonas sp., Strain CCMP2087" /LENGTH=234 /DNA_ID=CAMNT_0043881301 /DNA_START=118 /DNA_END=822 /DNA_ORIENTATION=+
MATGRCLSLVLGHSTARTTAQKRTIANTVQREHSIVRCKLPCSVFGSFLEVQRKHAARCRAENEDNDRAENDDIEKLKQNIENLDIKNPFEGLRLDEKGDLVDEKTGAALNDFGATRWDVAVRAMRGDIGGQYTGEESTEKETGQILGSLIKFPAPFTFQVVGKASEGFAEDMMACVSRTTGIPVVEFFPLTVKERGKGGKYLSLGITVVMESPAKVQEVYDALGKDARVMFKY